MAQKRKSTKKNLAFESLDVDLKKSTDMEAGRNAVSAKSTPEPVTKKKTSSKEAKAEKQAPTEELIRTTIDFPKNEHRKLKILAMDQDMKLYQYLYSIIKKHLDKQS